MKSKDYTLISTVHKFSIIFSSLHNLIICPEAFFIDGLGVYIWILIEKFTSRFYSVITLLNRPI